MAATLLLCGSQNALAAVFDGGVDSANLGKGEWIYVVSQAINQFSDAGKGPYVPSVNSVSSMMSYVKNTLHVQFIVVKAGSGSAYYPSQASPQFTTSLVNAAHAQDLKIFGYTLSTGTDAPGEIAVANYVYNCGADGFILDAEGAWETLPNNQSVAWQLCGGIKTNWPTKFLAHSPFANYISHSSFPYKEFGYWCDTVMPQVYWVAWGNNAAPSVNQYRTPALGIQWMDSNFSTFQNGLSGQGQTPPTFKDPSGTSWTNAIKPLAPIAQADTPGATNQTYTDMTNFVNYLKIDPTCVTSGGYKGCLFFRPGLQDEQMLKGIAVTRIGINNTSPSIVSQPLSRTNNADTLATFTVAAVGSSPFTYYWRRNGAPLSDSGNISGSSSATLTISSVKGTNAGSYSVSVGNAYGSELSSAAELVVVDPFISIQPLHQTNAAGGTSLFTVTAIGTAPFFYQWQKNDVNLSDSGNVTGTASSGLTITNIGQSDQATYKVVVSNSVGSIASSGATLTVTGPPNITAQPQSTIALAGTDATFNVGVTGNAPLSYQWYRAGQQIPNATASSFTVTNVTIGSAGDYSVTITNALGTITSSNALLTMHYALTLNVNGSGSLSASPNQPSYAPGSLLTITATPNAGCSFLNWSGDASGSINPLSITMDSHKTISANFSFVTLVEDVVIVESRSGGANYSAYADANFSDSSLKSTAPDCSSSSIGSRYGTVSNCVVTLKPTLANAGKTYLLQVTHGSSANISSAIMVNATIQGGSFKSTNGTLSSNLWTSAFQQSSPDAWKTVGEIQLNPNVTQPTITFTTTNKNLSGSARFASDGYRLAFDKTTTTTLTSSTNHVIYGHPFTLTAKVNATEGKPSGIVTFYTYMGVTGTAVLDASGVATLQVTELLNALDNPWVMTAQYEGDANFSSSTATVEMDIGADTATINLQSSANPSISGAEVTITATLTGTGSGIAYGAVDFYEGETNLGSPNLDRFGVATLTITNLSAGDSPHLISAFFAGDWGYDGAASAPLSQFVMDPPVITTEPANLTQVGGTTATFSAVVTGTPPLTYHWFKNGLTPVPGETNVLHLSPLHRSDSGTYHVVVSNLVGTAVSDSALLVVHVPQRLAAPLLGTNGSIFFSALDADGGLLTPADLPNLQAQFSTNLTDWLPLPDALTINNGTLQLQDPGSTNGATRFYRILENW